MTASVPIQWLLVISGLLGAHDRGGGLDKCEGQRRDKDGLASFVRLRLLSSPTAPKASNATVEGAGISVTTIALKWTLAKAANGIQQAARARHCAARHG